MMTATEFEEWKRERKRVVRGATFRRHKDRTRPTPKPKVNEPKWVSIGRNSGYWR